MASSSSLKRVASTSSSSAIASGSGSSSIAKKPKLASIFTKQTTITTTIASTSSIPFSLPSYIASLSTTPLPGSTLSELQLLSLELGLNEKGEIIEQGPEGISGIELSWLKLLSNEIRKKYFLNLKLFLWNEGVKRVGDSLTGKVFPPASKIYSFTHLTPLPSVRVLILGQDPYHDDNQAHGLCFSVQSPTPAPPSLKNIYKELKTEYGSDFIIPKHGDLTPWAKSSVLLLNTSLTVAAHKAGSHSKKGWEEFTDKLVNLVDQYPRELGEGKGKGRGGVVIMAWGNWAAKRVEGLDGKRNLILKSAHPSPLSAHRGFLGNNHFKLANDWLVKNYGEEAKVDWTKL